MHSKEELQRMIKQMNQVSSVFYGQAVMIGNHAFIEFTGLMNEYIKLCEQSLEEEVDFTQCNVHCGKKLVVRPHNVVYLREKLECIFETALDIKVDKK